MAPGGRSRLLSYAVMRDTWAEEDEETTQASKVKILRSNGDAFSLHKPPENGVNNWRRATDRGEGGR